jgi:acetate kinase
VRVLTLNCGSSSLKFDVFEAMPGKQPSRAFGGSVERIGTDRAYLDTGTRKGVEAQDHCAAFAVAIGYVESSGQGTSIDAIGHRVVHGGLRLTGPSPIDDGVLAQIRQATELAPLHNAPALAVIEASRERFGPSLPMVASFDTAFFADLPEVARTYALPSELSQKLGIRRFGFHGLAHGFMIRRYAELHPGKSDAKLITLQLGSGCSMAACAGGRPVDTSMGFTPLEGLVMATRSGDIDPALPLYLQEKEDLSADEVESLLNNRSGLLGLSGRWSDVRDLDKAAAEGDGHARLALDVFYRSIVKYAGAYMALLGGADAIVFGGGIGEHNAALRDHVCGAFAWAGLQLDASANSGAQGEGRISAEGSSIEAWVIQVNEASVIASETIAEVSRPR